MERALKNLDQAIDFHASQQKREGMHIVMCLLLRASINKNIMQEHEAVRGFLQAGRAIMEIPRSPSTAQLMQNVFKEIDETKKIYLARTGSELDVDALADEVDAEDDKEDDEEDDEADDAKDIEASAVQVMWLTNPLLMSLAVKRAQPKQ